MKPPYASVAIYAFVGILAVVYYLTLNVPHWRPDVYQYLHTSTINASAPSPFQYRVLVPYLVRGLVGEHILMTYFVVDILALLGMLAAFAVWLHRWTDERGVWLGLLITAAVLPMMYRWFAFSTSTLIEATLVTWGLLWLYRMQPTG